MIKDTEMKLAARIFLLFILISGTGFTSQTKQTELTKTPAFISLLQQPLSKQPYLPLPQRQQSQELIQNQLSPPQFSHDAGFYCSDFALEISHPDSEISLFYTLDGSDPVITSSTSNGTVTYEPASPATFEYSGPIPIQDRSGEPNNLSTIPTNHLSGGIRAWQEPDGLIRKGTIIRAIAVKGEVEELTTSPTNTSSYFVFPEGAQAYNLPVISIVTDSLNLFGEEAGIYVPGIHYTGEDNTGNYQQRGREWEREASFEFFETTGNGGTGTTTLESRDRQISQNVGIRIHGGYSRRISQKSLRIYSRSDYGESRINYPIFPESDDDRYNRLILRNSGNDFGLTMFKDAAAQSLIRHLNVDTQAYRPSIVFINGEYWGIHNIRERYDRHYLERVYGVDPDNVDILTAEGEVSEGSNEDYLSLIDEIVNLDLSDESNMDQIRTRMDIDNFLDYYAAQIYFGNHDWPHNNIDYWRLRVPYTPDAREGHNGLWRWLLYDVDFSLGHNEGPDYDMIDWVTRSHSSTLKFRHLLENENFKNDFLNRIAGHLNTAFHPDQVALVIDSLRAAVAPEIEEHGARWNYPASVSSWEGLTDDMAAFADERPDYLREHVMNHFDIPSLETITVNEQDPQQGTIYLGSIPITPSTPGIGALPWAGSWFSGIPVTLKAVPTPSWYLSHWMIDGQPVYEQSPQVLPEEAAEIEAVFAPMTLDRTQAHSLSDGYYHFRAWDEDETAGDTPPAISFVYMDELEPTLEAGIAGLTAGAYDLDSRTRINGLGENGFAFINTSNEEGNPGYPGRRLGGAVLALDTRSEEHIHVSWRAGTLEPNSRVYNLRLQYRIGSDGPFRDLTDQDDEPVEYRRSDQAGHSEFIGPVRLPDDASGQERVELLWRYYYTGERVDDDSGQRSQLNISEIHVSGQPGPHHPEPHHLSSGTYQFSAWPPDTTRGTPPPSMAFVFMDESDPGPDANPLGFTSGSFYHESRTRINGLGDEGFSFINTSNPDGNPGYAGTRLGGALLSLNTEGRGSITVDWTGGTVLPNSRIYNLRLQYRVGAYGEFRDVTDEAGNPVEYIRNEEAGHNRQMEPAVLPADAEDQPSVHLLWRYYYTGERADEDSGQRSQMNISAIRITSHALMGSNTGQPEEFRLFQNHPNPFYPYTTIRFDLPLPQHVTLDVFTVAGQRVATLADSEHQAGRHSITFNASSLASGVYLYRLTSELYTETGKMTVIK